MPTKYPRVTVTETPLLTRRLELAASRFPERARSRADLLVALTEVAEQAMTRTVADEDRRAAAKQRLLDRTRAMTPEAGAEILAQRDRAWPNDSEG